MINKNRESKLKTLGKIEFAMIIIIILTFVFLGAVALYAWPYRNLLGLGRYEFGDYYFTDTIIMEKIALVVLVIEGLSFFIVPRILKDYPECGVKSKSLYDKAIRKQLKKQGIEEL